MNASRQCLSPSVAAGPVAAAVAPEPVTPLERAIESRLQEMVPIALRLVADINLRWLVRDVAWRQFENDTDALLSTVITEAEMTGIVDPNEWWWQVRKLRRGRRYQRQPGLRETRVRVEHLRV